MISSSDKARAGVVKLWSARIGSAWSGGWTPSESRPSTRFGNYELSRNEGIHKRWAIDDDDDDDGDEDGDDDDIVWVVAGLQGDYWLLDVVLVVPNVQPFSFSFSFSSVLALGRDNKITNKADNNLESGPTPCSGPCGVHVRRTP